MEGETCSRTRGREREKGKREREREEGRWWLKVRKRRAGFFLLETAQRGLFLVQGNEETWEKRRRQTAEDRGRGGTRRDLKPETEVERGI